MLTQENSSYRTIILWDPKWVMVPLQVMDFWKAFSEGYYAKL